MLVAKALKVIRDDNMMEYLPKVVVVGKGTSYLEQVKSYINDNDLSDCFSSFIMYHFMICLHFTSWQRLLYILRALKASAYRFSRR